jgi:SAM-dependent methyltransferase
MDVTHENGDEQTRLWNGPAGRSWVDAQELLDQVLKPFEDMLTADVVRGSGDRVLDVGCGTGSTTLAIARELGASGRCTGIDISAPMIAAAQARAEREGVRADFIRADAQRYEFEPESFDMIVSRFGVMFFDDPVRAFANLRRSARKGARLRFVAWRSPAENPFMTAAERAAAPLLPGLPPRRPDAPGQFAFADSRRVEGILDASGWTGREIRPIDVPCVLPEKDLIRYLTRLGPVGVMLEEADERTRAQVIETIRPAFDSYVRGTRVQFTAACWIVSARAA